MLPEFFNTFKSSFFYRQIKRFFINLIFSIKHFFIKFYYGKKGLFVRFGLMLKKHDKTLKKPKNFSQNAVYNVTL